jgi:hypothetical protein
VVTRRALLGLLTIAAPAYGQSREFCLPDPKTKTVAVELLRSDVGKAIALTLELMELASEHPDQQQDLNTLYAELIRALSPTTEFDRFNIQRERTHYRAVLAKIVKPLTSL